jgi:hypothetical protein
MGILRVAEKLDWKGLTAICLTPGDSSVAHIYTQKLQRKTQRRVSVAENFDDDCPLLEALGI